MLIILSSKCLCNQAAFPLQVISQQGFVLREFLMWFATSQLNYTSKNGPPVRRSHLASNLGCTHAGAAAVQPIDPSRPNERVVVASGRAILDSCHHRRPLDGVNSAPRASQRWLPTRQKERIIGSVENKAEMWEISQGFPAVWDACSPSSRATCVFFDRLPKSTIWARSCEALQHKMFPPLRGNKELVLLLTLSVGRSRASGS